MRTHPTTRCLLAAVFAAMIAGVAAPGMASAALSAAAGAPGAPAVAQAGPSTAPCRFATGTVCQSTDPTVRTYAVFSLDSSGCTYKIALIWGDGSKQSTVTITSPADGTVFLAAHTYPYQARSHRYLIQVNGTVTAGNCSFVSFQLDFTLLTCSKTELSGPSWAAKFPDSTKVSDLASAFRADVRRFIAAMRHAGITERTTATLRLAERAYLMHYAWLVANRKLSPEQVPHFAATTGHPPVAICWVHVSASGADLGASVAAAHGLAKAFGVSLTQPAAPPLTSPRTSGDAIVMATTWTSATVTIVNGSGRSVTIRSGPHSGLNAALISVGASYGVIHSVNAKAAMDYWSASGR